MGLWSMVFLVFLVIAGALGYTIMLAAAGSIPAIIVLSFLAFITLFGVFQGFHLANQILRDRAENRRMVENLKENMVLMQEAFKVQGLQAKAQNQFLLGAGRQQKQIPTEVQMGDLFSEFEEGGEF